MLTTENNLSLLTCTIILNLSPKKQNFNKSLTLYSAQISVRMHNPCQNNFWVSLFKGISQLSNSANHWKHEKEGRGVSSKEQKNCEACSGMPEMLFFNTLNDWAIFIALCYWIMSMKNAYGSGQVWPYLTFVWGNPHFFLSYLNFQVYPNWIPGRGFFGLDSARKFSLPCTCCLSAYPVNTFLICINLDLPQDEVMSFGVE